MLTIEREKGGTALRWQLGPMSYMRVGSVVTFKAGALSFHRIGRMWAIGWNWR